MKRFELFFTIALIPVDALMLFIAASAGYFLRFQDFVTKYRPVQFDISLEQYLEVAIPWIIIFIVVYAMTGLYQINHAQKILTVLKKVVVGSTLGFSLIAVALFLSRTFFDSRFIIFFAVVFSVFFVAIGRIMMRFIRFAFFRANFGINKTILFGSNKSSDLLSNFFATNKNYGVKIVKTLSAVSEQTLDHVKRLVKRGAVDSIIVAAEEMTPEKRAMLLEFAQEYHLGFSYVADVYGTDAIASEVNTVSGLPLVTMKQTSLEGWGRIYKRTFDIIFGTLLFLLFSPIMLIIAIVVRIDSPGAAIYKNERVGKEGKLFKIFKFRRYKSEYNTGPGYDSSGKAAKLEKELIKKLSTREGALYKVHSDKDPRSTRVGVFLEKTSLDELPQFLNVVLGHMSLVGPRPHQPREVEKYEKHHKVLLAIKPGITGLAQISGRSDLDFEDEYRLDQYYVRNWSIWMDLAILLKTPLVLLKRHK